MLRVFEPAFYEMSLDIFELELLLEEIDYIVFIHAVLTSIDIGRDESALREGMDADMALGDDNETAPPAWVFDVIVGSRNDNWFSERTHAQSIAELRETGENSLFTIKALRIPTVAVDSNMFSKMGCHRNSLR